MRALLVLLLATVGCGGDDSGGTGNTSQCPAFCDKQTSCGETARPNCVTTCEQLGSDWNPDYFDGWLSCYIAASPCDNKTDDTCASTAYAGLTSRSIDADFKTMCRAKQTTCGMVSCTGGEPDLSLCDISIIFSAAAVSTAQSCLADDCATYCACVRAAFPS